MGAQPFATKQRAKTIAAAFQNARTIALHTYGHGGYTGTIAEKGDFTELKVPNELTADAFVERAMNWGHVPCLTTFSADAERTIEQASKIADDKWGPAVAIEIPGSLQPDGTREFAFFGWASS